MDNNLEKRYKAYSNEKLEEIIKKGIPNYTEVAVKTAFQILISRDYDESALKKLDVLGKQEVVEIERELVVPENLNSVLQRDGTDNFSSDDLNFDNDDFEKEELYRASHHTTTNQLNYKPLIFSVILLVLNFYLAGEIRNYNFTGKASPIIIDYLQNVGWGHDIFFRILIVGLIVYYIQKQKGKYLWGWILAGILLGAWVLLIVGFVELATDYSQEKYKENNISS